MAALIEVSSSQSFGTVHLELTSGARVGQLDARYSQIVQVLHAEAGLELQAYLTVTKQRNENSHSEEALKNRKRPRRRQNSFTLSLILYGTMDRFDEVGSFFSQCSEYLQLPLQCDRNVPYRNPQSLYGRAENLPMTNQFQAGLPAYDIETLTQSADPSAELETSNIYPESEPPSAIRTLLYR